jgi:anaerobic magnesium-protoporphyrin IX monomethyl ester cyclase
MEKILFVIPPNISFENFIQPAFNERKVAKSTGEYGSLVSDMPLGLLSLSAYLQNNIQTRIKLLDFNVVLNKLEGFTYGSFGELYRQYLGSAEWQEYSPQIIGISTLFSASYCNLLELGKAAREIFPRALLIAGGGVPTNMHKEIFRDSSAFDALCYGEGEKPLLGLLQAGNKEIFLRESPAWITKEKSQNGESFCNDFIQNLDQIPFFPFEILDARDYTANPLLSLFPLAQDGKISMPVLTSRGCPHRCCFCDSHTVHGRKMRYYSLTRIKEDLKRLKEEYEAGVIVFFDDHFMAEKQRVYAIIAVMKELGLSAFFPSSLALYALDREMLEALKGIGVENLVLSAESGSNRVLKEIMHKPLDLATVKRVVDDCRELGIASDIAILIGLPGETKQDIEDTRAFLKTLNANWFRISMATPLAGSEMFETCVKKNYLKGDYLRADFKRGVIETEDFSAAYIQEKAYYLNLELNFVENKDFKLGNYATALKGFQNTIRVKNDHAFAYYFAAQCCRRLGQEDDYQGYKIKYRESVAGSRFWEDYVKEFNLPPLE